MVRMLSKWVENFSEGLNWLIMEMDVSQWGIVSVIFVIVGFMALRTRI